MAKNKKSWLDKYEIIDVIDNGGNAIVYQVRRMDDGKVFALKHQTQINDEKKQRFINEVNVMLEEQKTNEGILEIIDYSLQEDTGFWYVMPIAQTINVYLKNKPLEEIVKAVIAVGRALEKLHSKEITHRDIKPANLFYLDGYKIGDFGLVCFPDSGDCTQTKSHLGAWSTMAPEMRRNPKYSDGKKADVYSLAKTLWILIKGDEAGFDGEYSLNEPIVLKPNKEKYSIVDIHELLLDSTKNIPDLRPDMKTFCDRLQAWIDEKDNWWYSQFKEWTFVEKQLFVKAPERAVWEKPEDIVNILNIIAKTEQLSHLFLPERGGVDLRNAEVSVKKNEILINKNAESILLKPKTFTMERFGDDSLWNYFILEIENDEEEEQFDEIFALLPDGGIVRGDGIFYGVYDYEQGKKLPDGYQIVRKYYKGNLLFVLKSGLYNMIRATYDARHGLANINSFREYIKVISLYFDCFYEKNMPLHEFLNLDFFSRNPFSQEDVSISRNQEDKLPVVSDEYMSKQYKVWDFSSCTDKISSDSSGLLKYYIRFNVLFEVMPYRLRKSCLCTDGLIKEYAINENEENDIIFFADRNLAEQTCQKCRDLLTGIIEDAGFSLYHNYFNVEFIRNFEKAPEHIFTREEIRKVIYEADDRHYNCLVIDENGYPLILHTNYNPFIYPVRCEQWDAYRCFTGKYAKLDDAYINELYHDLLYAWVNYLQSGTGQYTADVFAIEETIEELEEKVAKIVGVDLSKY